MIKKPDLIYYLLCICCIGVFVASYPDLVTCQKITTHDSLMWYGSFHHYILSIMKGVFPYWDPFLMTGTYFYPNVSIIGLLDPSVLLFAVLVKLLGISPVTAYIYFRLFRLALLTIGAFVFFRHISGCRKSAIGAAGILMLALSPGYFVQEGNVDMLFLTPFALFCTVKFLECENERQRYLYLAWLTLLTGISMNIFIPAYYLFNLVAFIIVLFFCKISRFSTATQIIGNRRTMVAVFLAMLVITLMTAPSLMLRFKDGGDSGELFPVQRIVLKNDGKMKRIIASEVGSDVLSDRFTAKKGVFASYGNYVNVLYPDIFESLPFFADDLLAEIGQYIGIIPLILAILGFIYHRSRYRYLALAMAVLISINMFSFAGMSGKPFNLVQKIFNIIFPPLKLIEVREVFGGFVLFYYCILLCLGLSMFFRTDQFREFLGKRISIVATITALLILIKVAITWYWGHKIVFASRHDQFVMAQLFIFLLFSYFYGRRLVPTKVYYLLVLVVVCADMYYFGRYAEKYNLKDSGQFYRMAEIGKVNESGPFQYLRKSLGSVPGVAFGESVVNVKGVLTYGINHTMFTTKRYYDMVSSLSLQNHVTVAHTMSPLLRFYPVTASIQVPERQKLLNYYAGAPPEQIIDRLFVEKPQTSQITATGMGVLHQYEDLPWGPQQIMEFAFQFDAANRENAQGLQADMRRYLQTPVYNLEIKKFTTNELTVAVSNNEDGYLYYGDGWSKYWEAYDGERQIPVLIANYNGKSVWLDKGEHLIRFVFNPFPYRLGLLLYYIGLGSVALVIISLSWMNRLGAINK